MSSIRKYRAMLLITLVMLMSAISYLALSEILVSLKVLPNVINLKNSAQVITIGTDIVYGNVTASSVRVNGLEVKYWTVNDAGFFAVKMRMSEIRKIPLKINDYNTFSLKGTTASWVMFVGSCDVMVINQK